MPEIESYKATRKIVSLVAYISGELSLFPLAVPYSLHEEGRKVLSQRVRDTIELDGVRLPYETIRRVISTRMPQPPEITTAQVLKIASLYDHWELFEPGMDASFLEAHWALTYSDREEAETDLYPRDEFTPEPPGYRKTQSAWTMGFTYWRIVPDAREVKEGMARMFAMIERREEHPLILSALVHFFILHLQPFEQYSGILARFWQFLIMARTYPIFTGFSIEGYLCKHRRTYLHMCKRTGSAGAPGEFIEFMLGIYAEMLGEIAKRGNYCITPSDRIEYFHKLGLPSFTRKDYMKVMKHISAPTASRDLKEGVIAGLFERTGTKNNSKYSCQKTSGSINTSGLLGSTRPEPWPPMPAKRER